jgi:DNA-binding transcriptional ArsR family regulator
MHDVHEEIALKALSHGLRVRILDTLYEAGEASPSVIARSIGEATETVANHVKLLTDWGLIERVRVEQVGQRRSNIYRITSAAAPTLDAWRRLPPGVQQAVDAQRLRTIVGLAAGVANADEPGAIHRLGVLGVLLDDEGVARVQERIDTFVADVRRIEAEARDRQRDDGVDCKLVLMLLSTVDEPDTDPSAA